jgi:AcrR family transcriptional regulator
MATQLRRESPAGFDTLLWERELPTSRDRQLFLQPEQIAHAAFELAEHESLAATSVKRVANRLGVPSLRLEQYLPSRQDLLDLMLDVVLGEIQLPQAEDSTGWDGQLRAIATATHEVATRHPWLVELIGGRPPGGPNGLRFIERGLAAFAATSLSMADAAQCLNTMQAFVCGSVRMHDRATGQQPASSATRNAEYLLAAVAGAEYPCLAELFASPSQLTSQSSFEYGLNCLLDGIAQQLEAATTIAEQG